MPKIQEVKGQYLITIPREKILLKGWKKGDLLDCNFNTDGDLILSQVKINC